MPKKIGGLFYAFCIFNANAATTTPSDGACPVCYKCSNTSCTSCVYDPTDTDCMGQEHVCANANAEWDDDLQKCVCKLDNMPVSCGPWSFYDSDADVCDCVDTACESGFYASALNVCKVCPEPEFVLITDAVESTVDYATDTNFLIGGYNGCYVPSGSLGADDSGVFELADDCKYTTKQDLMHS